MAGTCKECGKTLTDSISIQIGIGPICRVKLKQKSINEKTLDMFSNQSSYDHGTEDNLKVLYIIDMGKQEYKSVTNNAENVLNEIMELDGINVADYKVMYKDSDGIWDGIKPTVINSRVTSVNFFPIGEREYSKAIKKLAQ